MRVIVLDDEKILTTSIQRRLSEIWYNVEILNSNREFYQLQNKKCDIYLIDISLTDGNGIDVVQYIRNELKFNTPIMIISWHESVWHKIKSLDCGADDYITKPFSFDELTARIRSIMRRWTQDAVTCSLRYKDIVLDLNTREVRKWDFELSMTKKEKLLLEFFLYNKGKFITTEELESSVWSKKKKWVSKNTINVTIFKVRQKLWNDFNLQTKTWEWYCLVCDKNS